MEPMKYMPHALAIIALLLIVAWVYAFTDSQPTSPNHNQVHHPYEPFTVEISVKDR